ncbi:MAG: nitroreductase family protein [Clostridium sp.]|nr:nitroreductase family protein [Bacteroides sp.]MCM1199454.1 nitroreductase family protein [Clostridium sp.]
MEKTFREAVKDRRSYYRLTAKSPVDDNTVKEIIREAIENVPSAFNSRSTRIVLLLGMHHRKLWELTLAQLKKVTPAEFFPRTEQKVAKSFASAYGTILFFEDMDVIEKMQKDFPTYASAFPSYSDQTSAMHQFVIWTRLEELGFGASLQHYNPLIDQDIVKQWGISPKWRLVSQMPFGIPEDTPGEKETGDTESRFLVFE